MKERNGVRVGQRVRDVEGRDLGRVKELYESGFAVSKGLPLLFRRDWVVRYDEVRGVRDGALVLARSDQDLFALAEGGVPPAWRIPTPPEYPPLATPSEAQGVFEGIAAGSVSTEGRAAEEPDEPQAPPIERAAPPSARRAPAPHPSDARARAAE